MEVFLFSESFLLFRIYILYGKTANGRKKVKLFAIDGEVKKAICCKKWLVEDKVEIKLPKIGEQKSLYVFSKCGNFRVVINRKSLGDEPVFSLLLLKTGLKKPIIRLDLFGPSHYNEMSVHPYANQRIKTPHIHILNQLEGAEHAYPLNDQYAKMYIIGKDLLDKKKVLLIFLEYCHIDIITVNIGEGT